MKKATKLWLISAAALVVVGLLLFAVVMSGYRWDFTKLNTSAYETSTYEVTKDFHNISIDTDTADFVFTLSNNEKCIVECYEEETSRHFLTVEGDTLVIKAAENKTWYNHIGFHFETPKITVYLPKAEYSSLLINEDTGDISISKDFRFENTTITTSTGDITYLASSADMLKIQASTGNIRVENGSVGALALRVSTGTINVSDVICAGDIHIQVSSGKANLTNTCCKNLLSEGDTGDLFLNNVIAAEKFSIERDTGDVRFDGADAAQISVETDTGDITGTLLTDKIFIAETDTGRVDVPKTTTGGKCELDTDTGDIKISVKGN